MEFAHQQGGAGSGKTGQPKSSAKRVNEADYSTKDAVSFPWATTRTHENAAFEIDHYTSDACPNIKFHELLKKVLKTHRVHSMRGFLNALHSSNLVLQSKTEVFRLITGKGSSLSADELRATMLRHAKTDPAWMLKYGPAGDLPLHLAFLLGKGELGREMLVSMEALDAQQLEAYWEQCYRLHAKYPDTVDNIPAGRKDGRALIRWIVNLPYQSDLLWWFKEVARREQVGAAGHDELARTFHNVMPKRHHTVVLENDTGLFTGETLMHIALGMEDATVVEWLMHYGARLDAKAAGLFFQPRKIPILPDHHGKLFWQDKVEDNTRAGCYYGEFPLSFATSIGNVKIANMFISHATTVIEVHDDQGAPFIAWLDGQVSNLVQRSEEFQERYSPMRTGQLNKEQRRQQRLSAFINQQDSHGNTALHMAVAFSRHDMIEYLIERSATPSLSLMNHEHRTPLTLSLRKPDTFNLLLKVAFREMVWRFGDSEMTLLSLYQVDTFRVVNKHGQLARASTDAAAAGGGGCGGEDDAADVSLDDDAQVSQENGLKIGAEESMKLQEDKAARVFLLHEQKHWKSALQIVVEYEMHVLKEIPIFEQLIDSKWRAFGHWHHLAYVIAPYLFFFSCFNAGMLLRCSDVEAAFYNQDESLQTIVSDAGALRKVPGSNHSIHIELRDFRAPGQVAFRIILDVMVYILMVAWLLFKTWQDNKFLTAIIDVNQDLNISWLEIHMYIYKNMGAILNLAIVVMLLSAGGVRLSEPQGWLSVPYLEHDQEDWAIARELDILSVCCVVVWMNLLVLMLPYKKLGQLLLSIYSMLVGDASRWMLIFMVFLCAFSLASYVALIMSTKSVETVLMEKIVSRHFSFGGLVLQFCYMSAGEVQPGYLAKVARNVHLINLYNLSYLVLGTTVLVNLLVALMGSTFTRHSALGRQMWWLQFADLVLRYESRLSTRKREKYRTGESMGEVSEVGSSKYYMVSITRKSESDMAGVGFDEDDTHDDAEVLQKQVEDLAARMMQVQKDLGAVTALLKAHLPLGVNSPPLEATKEDGLLQYSATKIIRAQSVTPVPDPLGDERAVIKGTSDAEPLHMHITSDVEASHPQHLEASHPQHEGATPQVPARRIGPRLGTRRLRKLSEGKSSSVTADGGGEASPSLGPDLSRRRRNRALTAVVTDSALATLAKT